VERDDKNVNILFYLRDGALKIDRLGRNDYRTKFILSLLGNTRHSKIVTLL
jgi:hypothetical protein